MLIFLCNILFSSRVSFFVCFIVIKKCEVPG